jgi:hypothetical protein
LSKFKSENIVKIFKEAKEEQKNRIMAAERDSYRFKDDIYDVASQKLKRFKSTHIEGNYRIPEV